MYKMATKQMAAESWSKASAHGGCT